ncbi:M56 family peptidase [Parabacteroides sp. AF48-14]|uniref:M56 family metallopeptidase n=1 Tax=Parabacteroides sp. AF48-14 TaxID=2292052 RepID=UPI000EFDF7BD|nr:M56 family metallopeptidase [Parabacteroides sp. AF48-14]RHO74879.1 M56 family peptidase [Parabacteroides sp. AF48-14]
MITPVLIYFLKVNLALALLYVCYRLLFREDTFFRLRRGVLLSIYLVAFLYPLPDLSGWLAGQTSVADIVSYYSVLLPKETVTMPNHEITSTTGWKETGLTVMQLIWLAGTSILLFRCLAELFTVCQLYKKCRKITLNGIRICLLPKDESSYSFFKWIFISPSQDYGEKLDDILVHERTHVCQWHSADILLSEIVCIICWINPFAWWLKKEISINHEFIADEQVMLSGFNKKEYQYHLIGMEQPNMAIANLYNNFSVLPLKKRITMLNKKRTNSVRKVKYLALIPMAAGLLLLNNIDAMARVLNEKVTDVIQLPALETVVSETEIADPLPPGKDKIYDLDKCDIKPEFPGGEGALLQFLAKSIKYPVEAQRLGKQGTVNISFVIEKDGMITNAKIVQPLYPSLDKEALRVINSMPKWTPGKLKDGTVVRVQYTVPLTYRLQ